MINCTRVMNRVWVLRDRAGCCANLVVGEREALLFDTCSGLDDLAAAVRQVTRLPLRVVNSHGHYDHIGGNAQFGAAHLHPADMNLLRFYAPEVLDRWRRPWSARWGWTSTSTSPATRRSCTTGNC